MQNRASFCSLCLKNCLPYVHNLCISECQRSFWLICFVRQAKKRHGFVHKAHIPVQTSKFVGSKQLFLFLLSQNYSEFARYTYNFTTFPAPKHLRCFEVSWSSEVCLSCSKGRSGPSFSCSCVSVPLVSSSINTEADHTTASVSTACRPTKRFVGSGTGLTQTNVLPVCDQRFSLCTDLRDVFAQWAMFRLSNLWKKQQRFTHQLLRSQKVCVHKKFLTLFLHLGTNETNDLPSWIVVDFCEAEEECRWNVFLTFWLRCLNQNRLSCAFPQRKKKSSFDPTQPHGWVSFRCFLALILS